MPGAESVITSEICPMSSKKVTISGIGAVVLERSRRARHVNLTIRPFRGVRVAVPPGVTFEAAEAVARSKSGWIRRHLDRMTELEKTAAAIEEARPLSNPVARAFLLERIRRLAAIHGFTIGGISVRRQRTRWGSCSARNHISLNLQLARLPLRLVDYAILHELVHTRIRHHGPVFWEELARCIDNAKSLDRELDRYAGLLMR
jgi:predicted metal-dependent hydrolase